MDSWVLIAAEPLARALHLDGLLLALGGTAYTLGPPSDPHLCARAAGEVSGGSNLIFQA